ncbi:MAG: FG-GAP-like repeat-containing protein [Planctomycetota bacterium]
MTRTAIARSALAGLVVAACPSFGPAAADAPRGAAAGTPPAARTQYPSNPFVFRLAQPRADERLGGISVADVNDDGLLDYLYTTPGTLGAYDHSGAKLWTRATDIRLSGGSESEGLPGLHAPGVQAADVDGDGRTEVLYLTEKRTLVVLDGATGREERVAKPRVPAGAARWEHLVVANLRGRGDSDVVLQATPEADSYKLGRFVAAFAFEALDGEPFWSTDRFRGLAHGPLRVADFDGDGRDEICGLSLYDPDGKFLTDGDPPRGAWHIDSLSIYDVRPDLPGLEAVLFEEGPNHVVLLGTKGRIWRTHHERQEPQNAAVGEFDLGRQGLEIWCRSRYDTHHKPWVFDANGKVIASYELSKTAPSGWTVKGVEEISAIDWTGKPRQLAAAKERHERPPFFSRPGIHDTVWSHWSATVPKKARRWSGTSGPARTVQIRTRSRLLETSSSSPQTTASTGMNSGSATEPSKGRGC